MLYSRVFVRLGLKLKRYLRKRDFIYKSVFILLAFIQSFDKIQFQARKISKKM